MLTNITLSLQQFYWWELRPKICMFRKMGKSEKFTRQDFTALQSWFVLIDQHLRPSVSLQNITKFLLPMPFRKLSLRGRCCAALRCHYFSHSTVLNQCYSGLSKPCNQADRSNWTIRTLATIKVVWNPFCTLILCKCCTVDRPLLNPVCRELSSAWWMKTVTPCSVTVPGFSACEFFSMKLDSQLPFRIDIHLWRIRPMTKKYQDTVMRVHQGVHGERSVEECLGGRVCVSPASAKTITQAENKSIAFALPLSFSSTLKAWP